MNFQRIILIIALIFLIIMAVLLVYSIRASLKTKQYVTNLSNCPDYWIDATGNGSECKGYMYNTSAGEKCSGTVNFSGMSNCEKYYQMQSCRLNWNGITYGNKELETTCRNAM
jgi:hypothetical protein